MNLKDSEYESITKNKDNTGRDMEYEFNKEKNMRNLRKYLDFETAPSKK